MAESKFDSARRVEEEVKASDLGLLVRASEYCSSVSVQRRIGEFQQEHADSFADVHDEESENSLEHTKIFEDYVELLDGLIESFLNDEGASHRDFMAQCQDVLDGKFCALFEENENAWFVELLHSWTDFASFKRGMIIYKRAEGKYGK